MGAGFVDGLQFGDNTKAAVIRLGLMEMVAFCRQFFQGDKLPTYSAGLKSFSQAVGLFGRACQKAN